MKKRIITPGRIAVGAAVLLLLLCAIGWMFAPNDPAKVDLGNRLADASSQYPLGTDTMGRCVLSRVLAGGQTTLSIVLTSMVLVIFLGVPSGLALGILRANSLGTVLESILNAITAIPPIAYLIVFIGAWGSSIRTLLIAISLSLVLRVVRLVKAQVELESRKAYVYCAEALGASSFRLLFVHIFPNIIKETVVFLSLSCADMISMITSFSFIGLGPGDTVIDWGSMIQEAQSVALTRPGLILVPVAFVILSTVCFNTIADRLS